jgi:hypothetical protein
MLTLQELALAALEDAERREIERQLALPPEPGVEPDPKPPEAPTG